MPEEVVQTGLLADSPPIDLLKLICFLLPVLSNLRAPADAFLRVTPPAVVGDLTGWGLAVLVPSLLRSP